MYQKLKRKIINFFKSFFLINDTSAKIAGGAALGVFLGIVPGEGVATTLILASLFRLNRLAAIAGVLATNMWTTVVILPLAAAIGAFLFHTNSQELIHNFDATYHLGLKYFLSKMIFFDLVLPLVVGFVVIAGAIASGFYFLLYFLLKYRKIRF